MENTLISTNELTYKPMTPDKVRSIDDFINSIQEEINHIRQLSLVALIKPFAETQEIIKNDRKLAEALAELYGHQRNLFVGLMFFLNGLKSQIHGLLRYQQKEKILKS